MRVACASDSRKRISSCDHLYSQQKITRASENFLARIELNMFIFTRANSEVNSHLLEIVSVKSKLEFDSYLYSNEQRPIYTVMSSGELPLTKPSIKLMGLNCHE